MGRNPIGSTDLIGLSGVRKSDPRIRLNGAIDEASSSLSLAKSMLKHESDRELLTKCQVDLSNLMGFVARIGTPRMGEEAPAFFAQELAQIEQAKKDLEAIVSYPRQFIHPGYNQQTGSLDLARSIVRRAEREATDILDDLNLDLPNARQYLNRLSSICYLLILKNLDD